MLNIASADSIKESSASIFGYTEEDLTNNFIIKGAHAAVFKNRNKPKRSVFQKNTRSLINLRKSSSPSEYTSYSNNTDQKQKRSLLKLRNATR